MRKKAEIEVQELKANVELLRKLIYQFKDSCHQGNVSWQIAWCRLEDAMQDDSAKSLVAIVRKAEDRTFEKCERYLDHQVGGAHCDFLVLSMQRDREAIRNLPLTGDE